MSGIIEVAKLAGVSTATVSRALSSPEVLNPKTRAKVMSAIETLGYKPNARAQNLRQQRSELIVAIMNDLDSPFMASVVQALESQAKLQGYSVIVGDSQRSLETEISYADLVRNKLAAGIIQMSPRLPFKNPDHASFVPIVSVLESFAYPGVSSIRTNNHDAACTATNHLLNLGHRRIAVVTGPETSKQSNIRLQGYYAALQDADIEVVPEFIIEGDYRLESGLTAAKRLVTMKPAPTAVFCFNDLMAFGVISGAHRQGITTPDNLSVVGFDDIALASIFVPALTTVSQPAEEIGRQSADVLIRRIENPNAKPVHIELPFKLCVRDSTRAL